MEDSGAIKVELGLIRHLCIITIPMVTTIPTFSLQLHPVKQLDTEAYER